MNTEQLHDGLNFLDDDLVEAVDALRSRKKKPLPLLRMAGLAACVAVLLGIGLRQFPLSSDESKFGAPESGAYWPMETVADMQLNTSGQGSLYSVQLSDLTLTDNGLTASVASSDLFPEGTQITVVLPPKSESEPEQPLYGLHPDSTDSLESTEANKTDVLTVLFSRWEETEDGIVIYADSIDAQ